LVMFHDDVEDRPELVGYEGLSPSEYSVSENVLSSFNILGNMGYRLAGDLDRPPVHPASETLRRWLPWFA